jgi:hypothetical protein
MRQLILPGASPCVLCCAVFCVQAGFNHDYGCVHKDVPEYEHLIRVLPRCFTEVMLRIANPLRELFPGLHKNGPKGEHKGCTGCWG